MVISIFVQKDCFLLNKASGCEAEDAFSATFSATTGAGTTICVAAWRLVFLIILLLQVSSVIT